MSHKVTKNELLVLRYFAKILSLFDILSFKNSSDQGTPPTGCFQKIQSIDLKNQNARSINACQVVENNFERVRFSVKI